MNYFDGQEVDRRSFSWLDLTGEDSWSTFTPTFSSLTVVGGTSYSGRRRFVGRKCEFQVQLSAATSIASAAGTTYLILPTAAKGLAGQVVMTDLTAKTAVGTGHIDVTNSRAYLPAQLASAHVFTVAGWYEI